MKKVLLTFIAAMGLVAGVHANTAANNAALKAKVELMRLARKVASQIAN